MDFSGLIEKKRTRFDELESAVTSGSLYDDPAKAREILREHARLKELLSIADECRRIEQQIAENRELASDNDAEIAEMAQAELPELEQKLPELEKRLQIALLPPEPDEDRDAIVEIRAGTGGTEAALFAADLYRMYVRFAEANNLKIEVMDTSEADLGGLKEITFRLSGEGVFRKMRYESGVHRVQRVPATEAQGRIHTSTATVAVLPEAEEVDVELKMEDLRIEVCRAGGPGGQGVNTTDSAVQILHIPTGRIVRCQDGRSQQQNKERALQIMRSRLLEDKRREEEEKYSAHRKALIGGGGREEKIRTYNFPQNRVTDHRIEMTLKSLDRFIEGDIKEMIEALLSSDMEQRLQDAQNEA
ncbi:peptide chain release factor 1 [Terrimicrobium sacchariphilum]|uniref:Peptide chain release factor 1 n=1 Tax=Terrimicrobium sacchariphilum TaxID=690879 RepID=A0A146G8D1_TERSA|nr:peptide chain release factor 1 [Terrimicrobium sacchariphilum]GAT33770.1 peptide chain release factor 1 [Terrimicrobium sacchariphilum]